MKTLTLIKSGRGGIWAVQQLEQLVRLGIESVVLLPDGPTAEAARRVEGLSVEIVPGPSDVGNLDVLRDWRGHIRRAVDKYRPAVVHSHFVATTLAARFALGRRSGPPVVFQVPGPLHLEQPVTRLIDVRTARRLDHWIAGCKFSAEMLVRGGASRSRVHLAYYAGAADRWDQLPPPPPEAAGVIPSDRVVVGMVAYTYPPRRRFGGRGLKGHEDFIRALEILLEQGAPVFGLLIGGAWAGAEEYVDRLRAEARRRLGDAHLWLDTVPDVLPWYRTIDIAVHPSLSENLGGAAESMRAGVATIATDVGGFPDLIASKELGILIPPMNPEALASAIGRLVNDPARRAAVAGNGRRHALDLLDPRRNAGLVADVLRRVVDESAS
jgi:glycosyltransferase involved in cell wall biosynthesis